MSSKRPNETIVGVLANLADTVKWLAERRIVRLVDIPEDKARQIKQLEVLGLVCRNGSGLYFLQRERLNKMLKRVFSGCSQAEKDSCLSLVNLF